MAFCSQCGSEVAAGAPACGNCGAPLAPAAPAPPPAETSEPAGGPRYPWASTVAPAGSGSPVGGWIAVAAGLLVVVSIWLPWLTAGGDSYSGWDGLTDCLDAECPVSELFWVTDPLLLVTMIPILIGGLLVLFGILAAIQKSPGAKTTVAGLVIVLGLAAVITALIDVIQVSTNEMYDGVSTGFGIWLWLLAGVGGVIGGVMARR